MGRRVFAGGAKIRLYKYSRENKIKMKGIHLNGKVGPNVTAIIQPVSLNLICLYQVMNSAD